MITGNGKTGSIIYFEFWTSWVSQYAGCNDDFGVFFFLLISGGRNNN